MRSLLPVEMLSCMRLEDEHAFVIRIAGQVIVRSRYQDVVARCRNFGLRVPLEICLIRRGIVRRNARHPLALRRLIDGPAMTRIWDMIEAT